MRNQRKDNRILKIKDILKAYFCSVKKINRLLKNKYVIKRNK